MRLGKLVVLLEALELCKTAGFIEDRARTVHALLRERPRKLSRVEKRSHHKQAESVRTSRPDLHSKAKASAKKRRNHTTRNAATTAEESAPVLLPMTNAAPVSVARTRQKVLETETEYPSIAELARSYDKETGVLRPVLTLSAKSCGMGNQIMMTMALLAVAREARGAFAVALPPSWAKDYRDTVFHNLAPLFVEEAFASHSECRIKELWGSDHPSYTLEVGISRGSKLFLEEEHGDLDANWAKQVAQLILQDEEEPCGEAELIVMDGYFQRQRWFFEHFGFLRKSFWHEPTVREGEEFLSSVLTGHQHLPLVAIHYRIGDYQKQALLEDRYYVEAVQLVASRLGVGGQLKCFIFSDSVTTATERAKALAPCRQLAVVPESLDSSVAFYAMSLLNATIIGDSTYSYLAAVLGPKDKYVISPKVINRKPFNPFMYLAENPAFHALNARAR